MQIELSATPEQLRKQFSCLQTPEDVATLLDVSYAQLEYLLFIGMASKNYKTFTLSKANGGFRIISSPINSLKIIQQRLNQVLQAVYTVKLPVHGFVSGKSIVTNASEHTGQNFVFNIDLQNFFPSINFGRVRGLFIGKPYNLPEKVATILARICCYENGLPQGAPTSPTVSNMICGQMDDQLLYLARRHGCRYTRYADDITFSTSRLIFPPAIARSEYKIKQEKLIWHVGAELRECIRNNGFAINAEKVRMQTNNQHQEVTGLTINKFPNVSRQYIRQIRAMLHAWDKYGLVAAHREYYDRYNQIRRGPYKSQPSFKQIVKGKIEFLGMVRGHDDPIYLRFKTKYKELTGRSNTSITTAINIATEPETSQQFNFLHWIETLPFPLASILRLYKTEHNVKEKYEILVHFFEAWAEFWATILLSGFHEDKDGFIRIREKLLRALGRHDLSMATFGTWVKIVEVLSSELRSMQKQVDGLTTFSNLFKTEEREILSLLNSNELVQVLGNANSVRNKKAHGGILSPTEAGRRLQELEKQLNIVIEVFGEKWLNYKLIRPRENVFKSGHFHYLIEYIMGHGAPFDKAEQVFEHPLDTNRLFLTSPGSQQALGVWPLFMLGPSPETALNACYFYNSKEKDGQIKLVSYHFDQQSEIVDEFPELSSYLDQLSAK